MKKFKINEVSIVAIRGNTIEIKVFGDKRGIFINDFWKILTLFEVSIVAAKE